ncbi:SIS domain-containing protein [Streptomyces sp. CC228A]|uniref:SIS domain-containing protein n=1 Tax=Streptomyces sp. CC228A TaxID=2898186 RepID=UPI001F30546C|nr:sugar isomerase [Streptomyces sp. CC228A]
MSHVEQEIADQPACWRRARETRADGLPERGERVAVVGCGTSLYVAQSYAALREAAGLGETDAFAASEFPAARPYDRVVALTRSGTTTEVLGALRRVAPGTPTAAVTGDPGAPVGEAADAVVDLSFADERSVVQTRFATSALVLLRASVGLLPADLVEQAEHAVRAPLPEGALEAHQFTFLGTGWTVGLAHEAALKLREAAGVWTESYPAMEYRHGPVSVTGPDSAVWFFGPPPAGLAEQVAGTGALLVAGSGADGGRGPGAGAVGEAGSAPADAGPPPAGSGGGAGADGGVEPGAVAGRGARGRRRPGGGAGEGMDPLADLVRAQRLAVALAQQRGLDPDRPRGLTRSVVLAGAAERGPSRLRSAPPRG